MVNSEETCAYLERSKTTEIQWVLHLHWSQLYRSRWGSWYTQMITEPIFFNTSSGKSRVQIIKVCRLPSQCCLVISHALFSFLSGPMKLLVFSCPWPGYYNFLGSHLLKKRIVPLRCLYQSVFVNADSLGGNSRALTGQRPSPDPCYRQRWDLWFCPSFLLVLSILTVLGVTVKHLFFVNGKA